MLALRAILASQGALRTGYNNETQQFREYEFGEGWGIPVLDIEENSGDLDSYIIIFEKAVNESNLLVDNKLLSRLLLLRIGGENCVLLSAIHHSIWDAASSELFINVFNESLENGYNNLGDYSYAQYCDAIAERNKNQNPVSGEAGILERYMALAQKTSAVDYKKDPAYSIDLNYKLNASQKKRFTEDPIETAMAFLVDLMRGNSEEPLSSVPFAVLKHNRNERNSKMLGLTLAIHIVVFNADAHMDTGSDTHTTAHMDTGPESLLITENMLEQTQSYFQNLSGSPIPVVNYLGIFSAGYNETEDALCDGPVIEVAYSESSNNNVYMEYNIQNDTLNASILGIKTEKSALEEALKKL